VSIQDCLQRLKPACRKDLVVFSEIVPSEIAQPRHLLIEQIPQALQSIFRLKALGKRFYGDDVI